MFQFAGRVPLETWGTYVAENLLGEFIVDNCTLASRQQEIDQSAIERLTRVGPVIRMGSARNRQRAIPSITGDAIDASVFTQPKNTTRRLGAENERLRPVVARGEGEVVDGNSAMADHPAKHVLDAYPYTVELIGIARVTGLGHGVSNTLVTLRHGNYNQRSGVGVLIRSVVVLNEMRNGRASGQVCENGKQKGSCDRRAARSTSAVPGSPHRARP